MGASNSYLRADDYRVYGRLCRVFGVAMIVVGILVPLFTTTWYRELLADVQWDTVRFREVRYWDSPYLGILFTSVGIGIVLTVFSEILFREWEKESLKNAITGEDE